MTMGFSFKSVFTAVLWWIICTLIIQVITVSWLHWCKNVCVFFSFFRTWCIDLYDCIPLHLDHDDTVYKSKAKIRYSLFFWSFLNAFYFDSSTKNIENVYLLTTDVPKCKRSCSSGRACVEIMPPLLRLCLQFIFLFI